MPYKARFGENLCLVGSAPPLGDWDVARGHRLTWSHGHVWSTRVTVPLDPQRELRYKYFIRAENGSVVSWSSGEDLRLKLPTEKRVASLDILDSWDGSSQEVAWKEEKVEFSREEEVNVVAGATRRAFKELEEVVDEAFRAMTRLEDLAGEDAVAVDVQVAAQAKKALALAKASEAVDDSE